MKITVYTKNNCMQCEMTKKILKESYELEFKTINVEDDEEALRHVKEDLGFSSMPVVVAEGVKPFAGFRPDMLDKVAQVAKENK